MPQSNCGFAPGLAILGKKAGATIVPPATETNEALALEIQLQTKLKLARIVGRRRTAVVMAVARPLAKCIHVIDEWRRGRLVKAIKEIEAFRDDVESHPLTKPHRAAQTHVERNKPVREAHVARKISGRKLTVRDQRRATQGTGNTQQSVTRH